MNRPSLADLPADFLRDYRRNLILRFLGTAALLLLGILLGVKLDFSALRYPLVGRLIPPAAALVLACLVFHPERMLSPSWTGTIESIQIVRKLHVEGPGSIERRMAVELTVDRGEKKPYRLALFHEDGIPHIVASGEDGEGGGPRTTRHVNVFQTEAPYKVGDTLVYLRGLKYPARFRVPDATEVLDPKFVCPFCGEINRYDRVRCRACGKTMLH